MALAEKIQDAIERSSWIRKMFEEGARLKALHGADKVFDFSLGNPDLEPPEGFLQALHSIVAESSAGAHGYMANAGYQETRAAVAEYVSQEQGVEVSAEHVVMTCGAAGGLNCILKTLLDPGDGIVEVVRGLRRRGRRRPRDAGHPSRGPRGPRRSRAGPSGRA